MRPYSHICGRQTCAPQTSRKRNDSFKRIHSTAGRRGSRGELGIRGVSGPPGPARADGTRDLVYLSVPFPGSENHASAGGAAWSTPRRRRRRAPRPGLRAAATLPSWPPRPPHRRPRCPAAATAYLSARAGRGPRFRWGPAGAGKTSLGPSALYRLRVEARRGRNKRAPLPPGAGHCATSSRRDRPADRRASLARPAFRSLPSGLRALPPVRGTRPSPRGRRRRPRPRPQGYSGLVCGWRCDGACGEGFWRQAVK